MSQTSVRPKCCEVKPKEEEPKGVKKVLKKLYCFFFGCNCH